ncbi:MAG: 5-methyltetrahydropteroyltriglutamate--homocysteine S-methyltransferase [Betaproteobacteria bacterium]|nr:5-methyltetrahydropteroyltriglutamate--homocysteine S-methyltransferase [Betaproteobacteria bacterium]
MALIHNLGYPRIGPRRELKRALEAFWRGELGETGLRAAGAGLRKDNWLAQRDAGIDLMPVGDFAWYDHVLTTAAMLGHVPPRFGDAGRVDLRTYFAMARGADHAPALEMTKWFDTNYHYLVPEFDRDTRSRLDASWLIEDAREARALGIPVKPVVLGPLTYLWLGKARERGFDRLDLLSDVLAAYRELLAELKREGIEWAQLDEPALVLDLPLRWHEQLEKAYDALAGAAPKLMLATYFGGVERFADRIKGLPVAGVHLDLVRAPQQLDAFMNGFPGDKVLSAGIVDGRNVWRCDLEHAFERLELLRAQLRERLWLAPSCSLLHCPMSLAGETRLDHEVKGWVAFAREKLEEIAVLKRGLNEGRRAITYEIAVSNGARSNRARSKRLHDPAASARLAALAPQAERRKSPFDSRRCVQDDRLRLPRFPATTIGSFPQTPAIREARRAFRAGEIGEEAYKMRIRDEIGTAIARQEALDLDVLVHGEAERNDMVEYFGEQLAGFAFTANGWVQSYGSRCVKPPIIYGDVSRPHPMTVEWATYAQSLAKKPVKGMLTGPVTMLQWSFVRDDQPRATTALQIALAIRDEALDLENSGIKVIQIDEPALREGLPLERAEWAAYLEWATRAFRIAANGVRDETQVHAHMCYAEFADILPAIASLDADVITIETSRSAMDLLDAFGESGYPNAVGPGVYDIHSPRVPGTSEMIALLEKARAAIPDDRLWVNPDCGLKTRGWPEVKSALANMVSAARRLRAQTTDRNPVLPRRKCDHRTNDDR